MTNGIPGQGGQPPGQGGVACRYCGTMNDPSFVFCSSCGKRRMTETGPFASTATPPAPEPSSYIPQRSNFQYSFTGKEIDRTKTGVTLLIVAVLLLWIPYVQYLGDLLAIIGGILIILGRDAFGAKHSRNVIWTIVIYIVGIAIEIGIVLEFTFSIISAAQSGSGILKSTIQNSTLFLLVGTVIVGAFTGLVYVLAFYELESDRGKKLLWLAYAVQIVILVGVFSLLYPQMSSAINAAFSTNPISLAPVNALQTKETLYGTLSAIPMLIYAYTFNLARIRLNNREIP